LMSLAKIFRTPTLLNARDGAFQISIRVHEEAVAEET
jgi:hypothetical protein